jgi:prepilin-type N-terminal cleavage/methylation domain-containing protein
VTSRQGRVEVCSVPRGARAEGFSLVELLVASSVLVVVLAAAYGWVWSVAALADGWDDRSQAETIAATAVRAVAADVDSAVAVGPPSGRDPSSSLLCARDRADVAPEEVLLVWDSARCVLWRNASGTYVADHITSFDVGYVLSDGRRVVGATMAVGDWEKVRAVRLEIETHVGRITARRAAEVTLGPS